MSDWQYLITFDNIINININNNLKFIIRIRLQRLYGKVAYTTFNCLSIFFISMVYTIYIYIVMSNI